MPVTSVGDAAALEGITFLFVRRIRSARTTATRNAKRPRKSDGPPKVAAGFDVVLESGPSPGSSASPVEFLRKRSGVWQPRMVQADDVTRIQDYSSLAIV